MSAETDRLPLTGADAFLLAFDAETRRRNGASHLSQAVLRLAPGFDAEAFAATLGEVARANPILAAPIRRRLGMGAPEYRLDLAAGASGPAFAVHEGSAHAGLPDLFEERLNACHGRERGGLLHADAVRGADGRTDLALTWLHMLFDGAGSEHFLSFLAAVGEGKCAPGAVPAADRPGAPSDLPLPPTSRERGQMAMAWQRWMGDLGRRGVRSPAGPERGARQHLEVERRRFPVQASEAIAARASRLAGFLTPMIFYLGAAVRAHHAVMRRRGDVPESYVVPLPVNLRPKGAEPALFRTRVSLLWFQVESRRADDLEGLLAALKEQRRRAIAARMIENGVAAMEFARAAPSRLYGRMARRALGGELCSFFFAYTGEFCPDLQHFFGAPIEDGFGVPSVPASPGSGLVLSLRGGRLGVTHVRQRGVFDESELAVFHERLERDLRG